MINKLKYTFLFSLIALILATIQMVYIIKEHLILNFSSFILFVNCHVIIISLSLLGYILDFWREYNE